jgi:hypothetical protein
MTTSASRAVRSSLVITNLFIANCGHKNATISALFKNPNADLDSREPYLSELYFSCVFIYSIIAFCCFGISSRI